MPDRAPVPVTVVTGFLGAGKTTLVNRWLEQIPRGDVAVIVNEHGAVGIDGALLAARVRTLVEIAGGCVCCSTRAELVRALDELASSTSPPKRIIVETSGAASPAGVVHTVQGGADGTYVLDGVVTVVDATSVGRLTENDLALEQVGYADIVVLSRAELSADDEKDRVRDVIAAQNGAALVVSAASGTIEEGDLAVLLDRRRGVIERPRASPAPSAHRVYESVSLAIDGDVDEERFADFMEIALGGVAGRILRTKGILAVRGLAERMIVHGVADRVELSFGEPWGSERRTSRFVVVGFGLVREEIERAFRACAADVV